ncbi:MAG: alpha/beta fold hydrolase [Acidobacteriota bacterium]
MTRSDDASGPPPRPPRWEEIASGALLLALAPRIRGEALTPQERFAPFERVEIPRRAASGTLSGWWLPSTIDAARVADGTDDSDGASGTRAVAVLGHPWVPWGQGHFYRRGRIPALRRAGFDVLTFDLGGFGDSGPRPRGYFDRDLHDVLDWVAARRPHLPRLYWGISSGGYWAHQALATRSDVAAAVFEDVSAHLIEWSERELAWSAPFCVLFRTLFRRGFRYLDARRHAPHLRVPVVGYVGGAEDRGARPEDTRALATSAGGAVLIVDGAGHLDAIRRAGPEVIAFALDTFERGLARQFSVSIPSRR